MSNLIAFVIRRLIALVVIVFIVATAVFFLSHLSPYSPFRALLGQRATPSMIRELNVEFGLNKPIFQQYLTFMGGLLHLNLGVSIETGYFGNSVLSIIQNHLPTTLKLGIWSLIISLLIGLPAGLISALRQNTMVDHSIQSVTIVGYVTPTFVLCPLAQLLFGVVLGWFPVYGWGTGGWTGPFNMIPVGASFNEMVLPVAIFVASLTGYFAKSFRSFMLEQLRQDYVRTARAKGLKSRIVIVRHAVKNTLLPLFSIVGPTIAYLVIGAFIIELFFGIPGIGYITAQAVINSDYSVIEGTTLLLVFAVVLINMLTDISYAVVDPRVRL